MRIHKTMTSLLQMEKALRTTDLDEYQRRDFLRTLFWKYYDQFYDISDELLDKIQNTISRAKESEDDERLRVAYKIRGEILELCWDRYRYKQEATDAGFEV